MLCISAPRRPTFLPAPRELSKCAGKGARSTQLGARRSGLCEQRPGRGSGSAPGTSRRAGAPGRGGPGRGRARVPGFPARERAAGGSVGGGPASSSLDAARAGPPESGPESSRGAGGGPGGCGAERLGASRVCPPSQAPEGREGGSRAGAGRTGGRGAGGLGGAARCGCRGRAGWPLGPAARVPGARPEPTHDSAGLREERGARLPTPTSARARVLQGSSPGSDSAPRGART